MTPDALPRNCWNLPLRTFASWSCGRDFSLEPGNLPRKRLEPRKLESHPWKCEFMKLIGEVNMNEQKTSSKKKWTGSVLCCWFLLLHSNKNVFGIVELPKFLIFSLLLNRTFTTSSNYHSTLTGDALFTCVSIQQLGQWYFRSLSLVDNNNLPHNNHLMWFFAKEIRHLLLHRYGQEQTPEITFSGQKTQANIQVKLLRLCQPRISPKITREIDSP